METLRIVFLVKFGNLSLSSSYKCISPHYLQPFPFQQLQSKLPSNTCFVILQQYFSGNTWSFFILVLSFINVKFMNINICWCNDKILAFSVVVVSPIVVGDTFLIHTQHYSPSSFYRGTRRCLLKEKDIMLELKHTNYENLHEYCRFLLLESFKT